MIRRLVGYVAGLALLAVVPACGIGPEHDANRIDPGNVPFGLLEAGPTTTEVDRGTPVTIYLAGAERLVAVERVVPRDASLADLVELVVAGPTRNERALGATTSVPAGTVASVGEDDGVAEVDLTAAFGEVRSDEQLLALGQIVYTLTERADIRSVQFTLGGDPIGVPAPDGTPRDGPVSRRDVKAVAPR